MSGDRLVGKEKNRVVLLSAAALLFVEPVKAEREVWHGEEGREGSGSGGGAPSEGGYVETPRRASAPAAASTGGAAKPQGNTYTGPTHEPLGEEDIPF